MVDNRVERTRRVVLEAAREMLPEVGPMAMTYSGLSERTGVTRQTLYRHWPTMESVFVELVLAGPEVGYPSPHADPHRVVTEFLTSLRAGMSDATTAGALMALAAQADRDTTSADALAAIARDRRDALNILLSNTGHSVDEDEFARLVGPVMFRRFLARGEVTNELIDATVTAWLNDSSST